MASWRWIAILSLPAVTTAQRAAVRSDSRTASTTPQQQERSMQWNEPGEEPATDFYESSLWDEYRPFVCDGSSLDDYTYRLECEYGTNFACPFPHLTIPIYEPPSCCEGARPGRERFCVSRGGYFVSKTSYDLGLDYENYCCPKDVLASYINEQCHGPVQLSHEGVDAKDEACSWLIPNTPLQPVQLELVAPYKANRLADERYTVPNQIEELFPCLQEALVVCCPPRNLAEVIANNACPSYDNEVDGVGRRPVDVNDGNRRRFLLKHTKDKQAQKEGATQANLA
eukprot:CAMPEP_0176002168 /NCGR_PEP_ID=MMETSP0120_2-20121206/507_1 /TAXON_ID=160619 /ORGANISM="Kryptoperidinium foliaceum, Strain CCMP 1326" /LENGTH=283 /DNA_ID=CAMNT_0017334747 /DNA_START=538 /DNA_END=1389 /DNA_ORIENTATION=-